MNKPIPEADNSCQTQYPILLLHGLGYRDDMLFLSSWGRIPDTLQAAGAQVFLGGLDAWNSHENNALKLKAKIEQVLAETGAAKVNLIAHSKGGLESRYMISMLDMADKVASLTTVCTPHRGSVVADVLAGAIPDRQGLLRFNLLRYWGQRLGFITFDIIARITGDSSPQAKIALSQLTTGYMAKFNEQVLDAPTVYYQSYGTVMLHRSDDPIFALSFSILKANDQGETDGMVPTPSCHWGNFRGLIRPSTPDRGISHADMVDYRRGLVTHIDIPKIYLEMVADLKQQGF